MLPGAWSFVTVGDRACPLFARIPLADARLLAIEELTSRAATGGRCECSEGMGWRTCFCTGASAEFGDLSSEPCGEDGADDLSEEEAVRDLSVVILSIVDKRL